MAIHKALIVASFLLSAIIWSTLCEEPQPAADQDDEGPTHPLTYLSPEKRQQHSIMRFGKRPASNGHQLLRFGKRFDGNKPQHSYLFFGKRSRDSDSKIPELLQYLQRSQESSWKRGHNIMRFGKRGNNHNILRFGKRDRSISDEDSEAFNDNSEFVGEDDDNEDSKRNGHAMMYFGKRAGHSMMYFGKRGGHSMVHFGKRDPYEYDYPDSEESMSEIKRGPHSMIHFGKRDDSASEDKRAHSMIHFGKRLFGDLTDNEDDKRAHSMIHFGKREEDINDDIEMSPDNYIEEGKRPQHSMIHFGKRTEGDDDDAEDISTWIRPNEPLGVGIKRYHSLMRFGKRPMDGYPPRKGSHAMIHFGKRDDFDKRAHSMIHFGKRSIAEDFGKDHEATNSSLPMDENSDGDKTPSGDSKYLKRQKRQAVTPGAPVVTFVHYLPEILQESQPNDSSLDDYDVNDESYLENMIRPMGYRGDENIPLILPRQVEGGGISRYSDFQQPQKKQNSKNVFLRFGKR